MNHAFKQGQIQQFIDPETPMRISIKKKKTPMRKTQKRHYQKADMRSDGMKKMLSGCDTSTTS